MEAAMWHFLQPLKPLEEMVVVQGVVRLCTNNFMLASTAYPNDTRVSSWRRQSTVSSKVPTESRYNAKGIPQSSAAFTTMLLLTVEHFTNMLPFLCPP